MDAVTRVTLATGQVIEVAGDYETVDATFRRRQLADDGVRRVELADGRRITIDTTVCTAAVIEEVETKQRNAIGFR